MELNKQSDDIKQAFVRSFIQSPEAMKVLFLSFSFGWEITRESVLAETIHFGLRTSTNWPI